MSEILTILQLLHQKFSTSDPGNDNMDHYAEIVITPRYFEGTNIKYRMYGDENWQSSINIFHNLNELVYQ